MIYLVTHDETAAIAIDEATAPKGFDLQGALAHARQLLSEGKSNVAIRGNGHSISGDDLVACCKGDKTLSVDLRAILKLDTTDFAVVRHGAIQGAAMVA